MLLLASLLVEINKLYLRELDTHYRSDKSEFVERWKMEQQWMEDLWR